MSQAVALRRLTPLGYSYIDLRRPGTTGVTTNHGGVAAVIVNDMKCKVITTSLQLSNVESLCFTVTGSGNTIAVLRIYRPGSAPVTEAFFEELTSYMKVIGLYKYQIIVAGDLNIHVERDS